MLFCQAQTKPELQLVLDWATHYFQFLPPPITHPSTQPGKFISGVADSWGWLDLAYLGQYPELKKVGSAGSILPEHSRFFPGTHKARNYLKDVLIHFCLQLFLTPFVHNPHSQFMFTPQLLFTTFVHSFCL